MSWVIIQALANSILKNGITREFKLHQKRAVKRRQTLKQILLAERRSNEMRQLKQKLEGDFDA